LKTVLECAASGGHGMIDSCRRVRQSALNRLPLTKQPDIPSPETPRQSRDIDRAGRPQDREV